MRTLEAEQAKRDVMNMNLKLKSSGFSKVRKLTNATLASCLISAGLYTVSFFKEDPEEAIAVVLKKDSSPIERKYAESLFLNTCKISNKKHGDMVIDALFNASKSHSVDFELLLAVMSTESNCRQNAVSPRGALGLMQITPETAKWLGVSQPMNINQNVNAGAKYLAYLIKEFDGNFNLALAAYNAGPNAVRKYKAIPPYRETRGYVRGVLRKYGSYVRLTKV